MGIDPLEENINAAREHADHDPDLSTLNYECTNIESLCQTHPNKFDIVVASEVLEHVNNPQLFLDSCCNALKVSSFLLMLFCLMNCYFTSGCTLQFC